MKKINLLIATILIFSCSQNDDNKTLEDNNTDSNFASRTPTSASCDTAPYTVRHSFGNEWSRTLNLPSIGRFVQESHYVTTQDDFPGSRLFANTVTENINSHLQRSYNLYKEYDPNKTYSQLYSASFQKEWTPAEAGAIGQGSIGSIQTQYLTPEKEMWFMTMMWAPGNRPPIDTKFLLSANGKKVVVVAGYETGPRSQTYIGGLTPETHAWLGTNNSSQITVSYLANQSTPIGPIDCNGGVANNIPVPVSPTNGATNLLLPINFTYTSPVNAGAFRVQVSTSNSGWTVTNGFTSNASPNATVVVNASINTSNYYWNETALGSFEGPKAGKTYYYTIRSWDATTGTSQYSTVRTITTAFGVQPITPSNASTVNSPANLSWSSTTSGASYRLQISKVNSGWTADNGFTTDTNPTTNVPVNYSAAGLVNYAWPNQYTETANLPISGNTYYWTVRLWSSTTGSSKYSPVRSFTIN